MRRKAIAARASALTLAVGLSGACYSGVDAGGLDSDDLPTQGSAGDAAGDDSASGDDGDGSDSGNDSGEPADECGDAFEVGHTPLRRLTAFEYNNIARDLLGDDSAPAAAFSPDEAVGGFDFNTTAPVTTKQLDEYVVAAETLAATFVSARLDQWVDCPLNDDTCAEGFIADFGLRAFRRPLDADETAGFLAVYRDARDSWGAAAGFESIVQSMLLSPFFLYHFEVSDGEGTVEVDEFELAARLSFFLWGSIPDDALLTAATDGALTDPTNVGEHARRMLDDPRAGATIEAFHLQWMGLRDLPELVKDPDLFPDWSGAIGEAMAREVGELARHVLLEGDGRLQTLLTAPFGFVDAELAGIYGVAAPATPFERVDLDPDTRAGILTTAAFLTATSSAAEPSEVFRGRFVREQMLCWELMLPDDAVFDEVPSDADRLENEQCSSCHVLMDPIGFGFEAYNAVGAVDPEIAASGEVIGVPDIGTFTGPVELAHALADSELVRECLVEQWYRYALRRSPAAADDCHMEALVSAFEESEGDVRELIVALATSRAFRHRAVEAEEG